MHLLIWFYPKSRLITVYYTVYWNSVCTLRRIACIVTQGRELPPQPLKKALERTVTGVSANAFTFNINSTNGNTLIKADFS